MLGDMLNSIDRAFGRTLDTEKLVVYSYLVLPDFESVISPWGYVLSYLSSSDNQFLKGPLVKDFLEIQNDQIHWNSPGPQLLSHPRSYISIVM